MSRDPSLHAASLNPDIMTYIVICNSKDGPYICERMLSDCSKATTIKDIAEGQFKDVLKVIEFNTAEFSSRDVTEDFEALGLFEGEPSIVTAQDRADWAADYRIDSRKHEEAL